MRTVIALIVLAAALWGCSATTGSAPDRTWPLPTAPLRNLPPDVLQGCSEVAKASVLAAAITDPPRVWLVDFVTSARTDVFWPAGYRVRFSDHVTVFDDRGESVLQVGDFVLGGCGVGDPAGLLLEPPYLGLKLACGPMQTDECTIRVTSVARAAGWPSRRLQSVTFLDVAGHYVVRYPDGSQMTGLSRPG